MDKKKIKRIIAREGLILISCFVTVLILDAIILLTSSGNSKPNQPIDLLIGFFRVFLGLYIIVLIIFHLIRFIIWALKTLREGK
ncbi:MAG: hypothetical protein ABSB18_07770 [Candidatus Omnitrophota bacterium]